jgi:hypothetical protein
MSFDPLFDAEELRVLFGRGKKAPAPPSKAELDADLFEYMRGSRFQRPQSAPRAPRKILFDDRLRRHGVPFEKKRPSQIISLKDRSLVDDYMLSPLSSSTSFASSVSSPSSTSFQRCQVCDELDDLHICGPYKYWSTNHRTPQKIAIKACSTCIPYIKEMELESTMTRPSEEPECFLFYGGSIKTSWKDCIDELRKFVLARDVDGKDAKCDSCGSRCDEKNSGKVRITHWNWRCDTYSKKVLHVSYMCKFCHKSTLYDRTYGTSWSEAMDHISYNVEQALRYRNGKSVRIFRLKE